MNEKVRNHGRGVDELFSLYLLHHANGQMHMCLTAPSVNIINKHNVFRVLIQVNQDDFMLTLICVFLSCDLPI